MADLRQAMENMRCDEGLREKALEVADELLRLQLVRATTRFEVVDYGSDGVFLFANHCPSPATSRGPGAAMSPRSCRPWWRRLRP